MGVCWDVVSTQGRRRAVAFGRGRLLHNHRGEGVSFLVNLSRLQYQHRLIELCTLLVKLWLWGIYSLIWCLRKPLDCVGKCQRFPAEYAVFVFACVSGSGLYSMQYTRRCPMIATFVTMGVGSCLMEGYVNYKLGASPCGGDKNTSELWRRSNISHRLLVTNILICLSVWEMEQIKELEL